MKKPDGMKEKSETGYIPVEDVVNPSFGDGEGDGSGNFVEGEPAGEEENILEQGEE